MSSSPTSTPLVVFLTALTVCSVLAPAVSASASYGSHDNQSWEIAYEIDVESSGMATVTVSTNRSVGNVQLSRRSATNLSFVAGESAVEVKNERQYRWNTTARQSITYRVQLGQYGKGSGIEERFVAFRIWELVPVTYWGYEMRAPQWRFTLTGPEGWEPIMDGRRVDSNTFVMPPDRRTGWPKDHAAIGDMTVYEWTVDDEVYRVAKAPTSRGPAIERVTHLVNRTAPVIRSYMGSNDTRPKALIVATRTIERGGVAKHHTAVFGDLSPLYRVSEGRAVYTHEMTHMYQEWGETYKSGVGDWGKEGSATYLQHYALWQGGLINESQFKRSLRVSVTGWEGEDNIGKVPVASANDEPYDKGALVWAALDLDIRARTGGNQTLAAVFERVNFQTEDSNQGRALSRAELLESLETVTGKDYSEFYHNYVNQTVVPSVIFTSNYSLSDPVRIDHGPPSREELLERLEQRQETIQELRNRLSNETVDIDVTVSPMDGMTNFTAGDVAVVTAKSPDAEMTSLTVTADGETTLLGADGRAKVPLDEFGTKTLTFSYGNTTARTQLTVRPPVVPGIPDARPPRDLNDDGRYEDVDGDGAVTLSDVTGLAGALDSAVVRNNPTAFDIDGDGAVTRLDAGRLLFRVLF